MRAFARRVCFVSAPPPKADLETWGAILKALQTDQRLEIQYRKGGSGEPSVRKFDPYGLIVRNRAWFLYGYCHQHQTTLTLFVPYICGVRLLEDYFDLPANFDLGEYTRKGFMGLQGGASTRKVVLRFAPDAADAVLTAPFVADQKTTREPSGHLRVVFETNALFQVQREVLRWGSAVEVLSPKALREDISETARDMAGMYRRRT